MLNEDVDQECSGMSQRSIEGRLSKGAGMSVDGMLELGHKEAWGFLWRIILASGVEVGRAVACGGRSVAELASRITCLPVW